MESATNLFNSLFFDPKRYDLMRVGRYKFNKKLSIATRINQQIAREDVVDPSTGEVMVKKGEKIDLRDGPRHSERRRQRRVGGLRGQHPQGDRQQLRGRRLLPAL